jgi:hypothetical protein
MKAKAQPIKYGRVDMRVRLYLRDLFPAPTNELATDEIRVYGIRYNTNKLWERTYIIIKRTKLIERHKYKAFFDGTSCSIRMEIELVKNCEIANAKKKESVSDEIPNLRPMTPSKRAFGRREIPRVMLILILCLFN